MFAAHFPEEWPNHPADILRSSVSCVTARKGQTHHLLVCCPSKGRTERHLRPRPGVGANGSSKTPTLGVPPAQHIPCQPSPLLTLPALQPLLQRVHAAVTDPGVPFQMDPRDCLHQLQAPRAHRDQRIVLQVQVGKSLQWQQERDIKLLQAVVS